MIWYDMMLCLTSCRLVPHHSVISLPILCVGDLYCYSHPLSNIQSLVDADTFRIIIFIADDSLMMWPVNGIVRCIIKLCNCKATHQLHDWLIDWLINWLIDSFIQWCGFRRTDISKRSFRCAAPATWNSLPPVVINCDTLSVFKSRLKTHLFNTAYS